MKKHSGKLIGVLLAISMTVTGVFSVRSAAAESNGMPGSEMEQASLPGDEVSDGMLDEVQMPADESETDEEEYKAETGDESDQSGDAQTDETVQTPEESQPDDNVQGEEDEQEGEGQLPERIEAAGDGQVSEGEETAGEDSIPDETGMDEEPGIEEDIQDGEGQLPEGIEAAGDGQISEGEEAAGEDMVLDETKKDEEPEIAGDGPGMVDIGEDDAGQLQNTDEGIMVAADTYESNQPVIESFEFAENGQDLTPDDTLHFTVSAYDADSGIRIVEIRIRTNDEYGNEVTVSCTKDGDGNLYSGTVSCSELRGNHFYVYSVEVKDNDGNFANLPVTDNNGNWLYEFTIGNAVNDDQVSVSNIQMQISDANGDGKLSADDKVTYTADIVCTGGPITGIDMYIYNGAGDGRGEWVRTDYDSDAQKVTGTYIVTEQTYSGIWELNWIRVYTETGKDFYFYPGEVSPDANVEFEVVHEDLDTEKPVIESIIIDKNGQYVQAGDVITITVKVSDAHLPSLIRADFRPAVSNVYANCDVELMLNKDTGEYTGKIDITDDTYPCEWYLSSLEIRDAAGNATFLYDFREDLYTTYPWYYRVKAGNTYAENVKDVTFIFIGWKIQQDSNAYQWTLLSEKTVKNVGRRASLKELGVALPQPGAIEGLKTIGWIYNGVLVDENTQLPFFDSSPMSCYFTACYDKGYVNVSLQYMNQEGYASWTEISKFVDKEATYKDVLDMLELPADAETNNFAGFEFMYGCDGSTKVGNEAYISAKACYSSYKIEGTARCSDKDGNIVTALITKSYPAETKIKDILSDIGKPEDINGTKFEKWILTSALVNEDDEISVWLPVLRNFEVVALYEGKTTVDAAYTYRNENGEMVCDNKMAFIDGESLSDAAVRSGVGKAVNNLKHFDGLKLSEWTGDIYSGGHERYKKADFTAQYSNCVVTLNYPDGTPVYSIVDKGALFTLPTDKNTYKNIVWSGYGIGATVVVSGDMSFDAIDWESEDNKDNQGSESENGSDNSELGNGKGTENGSGKENGENGTGTEGTENGSETGDGESGTGTEGTENGSETGGGEDGTGTSGTENGTGTAEDGNNTDAAGPVATANIGEIRLPEREIAEITSEIANAANGAVVTVDMGNATVVPKQVLESIRGKSMDIVLKMNGYSWVINGMDVAATELKDINLEVKMDVNAIPASLVKSLAGENPVRQLSLTHNGDFGFRARLILNLGSEHSGETGNLYYYDSTGKLVFMDAGEIGKDGTVSLTFSHVSDCVVVIDSSAVAKETGTDNGSGERKSPKTGE